MKRLNAAIIGTLVAATGTMAQADILPIHGATVTRILVSSDTNLGGCMAMLSVPVGTGCSGNWVTFSCSGDFADKDRAYRMLDMAQMAYSLNKRISVYVDNARRHNGFCFASRIDIYN